MHHSGPYQPVVSSCLPETGKENDDRILHVQKEIDLLNLKKPSQVFFLSMPVFIFSLTFGKSAQKLDNLLMT